MLSCPKKKNTISLNITHVVEFSREGSQPRLPGPGKDSLLYYNYLIVKETKKKKEKRKAMKVFVVLGNYILTRI